MKKMEAKTVGNVMVAMTKDSNNTVAQAIRSAIIPEERAEEKAENPANAAPAEQQPTPAEQSVEIAPAEKKTKSKKEKKQSAEALKAEIERKTQELQQCLAELEKKKKLSLHRDQFIQALDSLGEAETKLKQEDDFNSALFKMKFTDASSYNSSEIFSVSNRFILLGFITYMREKITKKISEIETELING